MTEINMSSVITSVASTVIAAAIVWIASETHQHDITLTHHTDVLDRVEKAVGDVGLEITGEPNGLKYKTKWLHDTMVDYNVKAQKAIADVSTDLSDVKKEREKTNKAILDKLDRMDSRLTKVDGDHGTPYDADAPPH